MIMIRMNVMMAIVSIDGNDNNTPHQPVVTDGDDEICAYVYVYINSYIYACIHLYRHIYIHI
jgi:hypothetical protein